MSQTRMRASALELFGLPRAFPDEVETARATDGAVTLVLGNGLELRLGRAESFALKLAVGLVLRTLSASEQEGSGISMSRCPSASSRGNSKVSTRG